MKKTFIILFLFIISGGLYSWARFISTKGLIIKEYAISNTRLPEEFVGKKIVHFSDLHFASIVREKELKKIVEKINSLKPDICVFTGDLIDKFYEINEQEKKSLIDELSKIEVTIGKYSVNGNHDYEHNYYNEIMKKSGFISLDNKHELIYYKGIDPIVITGITSSLKKDFNLDSAFKFKDDEKLKKHFTLFIAHEPDVLIQARKYDIDLMLSGHSHGGQVRIPFIGALYTPIGSKKYYEEYYKQDETELYVSSGLGTSSLKIRFFNKPSINLFRLYKN